MIELVHYCSSRIERQNFLSVWGIIKYEQSFQLLHATHIFFGTATIQKASHLTYKMRDALSHPSPSSYTRNRCLETAKNSAALEKSAFGMLLLAFSHLTSFYANWFAIIT